MRTAVCLFFCLGTSGCVSVPSMWQMPLHRDETAMRDELDKRLQLNMPIEEAKWILWWNGFRQKTADEEWVANWPYQQSIKPVPGQEPPAPEVEPKSVVYSREFPWLFFGRLIGSECIDVRLFYDRGRLTDFMVRYSSLCL
jgi:hypothetical protein